MGQINSSMWAEFQTFLQWDGAYNIIEKNKVEGILAWYFMVRYCTVDGMVLKTHILSNILGVGVFWCSLGLKMDMGV